MIPLTPQQLMQMQSAILPLAVLAIENDEDREFMSQIYIQYRALMYKVAHQFFSGQEDEVQDAVSDAIENLCRYHSRLREIPEAGRSSYIFRVTYNSCIVCSKKKARQVLLAAEDDTLDVLENIPDESASHETLLSYSSAEEILRSFDQLTHRDRELIRMKYIALMDYEEIADLLKLPIGTVRTALCRAKKKLEKQAIKRREEEQRRYEP